MAAEVTGVSQGEGLGSNLGEWSSWDRWVSGRDPETHVGERSRCSGQGGAGTSASGCLLLVALRGQCLSLPLMTCDRSHGVLPTRKLTEPGFPGTLLGIGRLGLEWSHP